MESIKMAEEKKEKQSNNVGRASLKQKSEDNEKLAMETEETILETKNQTPLSPIPLESLTNIEIELVYIDEEDIPFEFSEPAVPTSAQSACCDSEKADAWSTLNDAASPQLDKQLQMTLRKASACYRQKNYTAAEEQFSTALQLCSKGAATDNPLKSYPEDVSSIASFIETKLVTCCLKLKKPDDALNHSHRSIILNPAYFRNHLRQAAVFRCLERYSEAARSAMIADYIYWLTGGTEQHTSNLIKLYWQAMIEEAITREVSFSVMYTPFVIEVKADKINKIKEMFAKKHPDYVEHIYTDPHGLHILPQTAEWPFLPPQQYLLTLGFRSKHIGKILERWSSRKLPIFSDRKTPFSPLTEEETKRYWGNTGKKIVPVMDFIRSTKLTRVKEQSQVINQAMAELATIPYLQDISQKDAKLLQLLMADAMDTLEGRRDKGRVWNKIQKFIHCLTLIVEACKGPSHRSSYKIGLIEDYLYQVEDNYLKNKRLRRARREKRKIERTQSTQQH